MAIVVALVPAAALSAHRLLDASSPPPTSRATDLPIPPVSSSAAPRPAPPSTPTGAQPRLPRIAPDSPRRITAGRLIDAGFDAAVTTIEPASTSEVARWKTRGSPGSPGADTVYVIGEVLGESSAFGRLPTLATGTKVSVRTDRGTMTYTVTGARRVPESRLAQDPLFTRHKPGRLVLVGIRYDASGDRLDEALVVTAQLSGARRT